MFSVLLLSSCALYKIETFVGSYEGHREGTRHRDATIAGVDNGSQTSMELFKANNRKAFNGLCLAVLKAGKNSGKVKLIASSEGLISSEVIIKQK